MVLKWTRTVLCVAGFVWVVLAWQSIENRRRADDRRIQEAIRVVCQDNSDELRKNGMEARQAVCEAGYILQTSTRGLNVTGTVDVTGNVDLQP